MSPVRATRAPALRYRPARRTDVEALADLGARAYRVASLEQRREFYTDHPRFGLKDVRVGEIDGRVVSSLVLYPLTAMVRGRRVPLAGVGSVAVSPEHRRRGIGEALMRAALRELKTRGVPFSLLYPFRASWYRRLGWGMAELVHQFAVAAADLPGSEEARQVRRLMSPDRERVQALYERASVAGHFALVRGEAWWQRRLWGYPGEWLVYEPRRGSIEGYLYYEPDSTKGPFKLALSVMEIVAVTPAAHRGLIGHLASLADQVEELHFASRADHVWPVLLRDPRNLHPGSEIGAFRDTGNLAHGALLRVVDVKTGLEAIPVAAPARGELAIEVDDPILSANTRVWRVRSNGVGRLAVTPAGGRAPTRARVTTSIETLASIVSGALDARRASETGLIETGPGALDLLEPWFRTAVPPFLHPLNAF
ncbi:MAG: enhanced intracellular survival protein Eis [Candidatus Eisenbacteria bacterium]